MEICQSEEGFDIRHSKVGSWGIANYSAAYSNQFSHRCTDGHEIVIAKVVTGRVYDCGTQQNGCILQLHPKTTLYSLQMQSTTVYQLHQGILNLIHSSQVIEIATDRTILFAHF